MGITPISDTTMLKLWLLALALVALQGPKVTLGKAAEDNQNEDIPLETEKMGNVNPVMEPVMRSYIEDPFVLESRGGLNRTLEETARGCCCDTFKPRCNNWQRRCHVPCRNFKQIASVIKRKYCISSDDTGKWRGHCFSLVPKCTEPCRIYKKYFREACHKQCLTYY